MFKTIFHSRFSVLYMFLILYVALSFLLRLFFVVSASEVIDYSFITIFKIFGIGIYYDFGVAVFFMVVYALYLGIVPNRIIGSWVDKIITSVILFITLLVMYFSFLGEVPFWEEFSTRYNFIAVDYLIYTYEVLENINQSYPLPVLITVLLLLCLGTLFLFKKLGIFKDAFTFKISLTYRLMHMGFLILVASFYVFFSTNAQAEYSQNTYNNELAKNGVYSFFAAYRSNELDYNTFYATLKKDRAFSIIKSELQQVNQDYVENDPYQLLRDTTADTTEVKPNIILICLESFSADFMQAFGNSKNITPNIDGLANESIFFTNMYATGTRTVRGMEAITLSVPPTPGNSIVRRPDNAKLFSIASVLKQKNYELNFFYGGDGYFDNMNSFFGGQGFNIYDRNRGNPLSDEIKTTRTNIEDTEVTHENAWGVCDEDIYAKLLKTYDKNYLSNQPTFSFVMTTSNHKPYTFPEHKIDMPSGSRDAAVKYTDYALSHFIETAKQKPWFKNTVFVVIADHCAKSAGKWEITIDKHLIPAFIYNLPDSTPQKVAKLSSQIDIMPTLFGYLNWDYQTALYGKDISLVKKDDERALIGNYRTIGLLKDETFTQLNDKKKVEQYHWDSKNKELIELKNKNKKLEDLTISYYQTASERFTDGKMKEN